MVAETLRCFVALDTPASLKAEVGNLIEQLRISEGGDKAGWVKPDGVHITLKFLGNVTAAKVNEIKVALSEALARPERATFDLSLGGLGQFGEPNAPRVIWLGINGNRSALNQLQQSVEHTLNGLGFAPEERGYNPHLTLAYVPALKPEEIIALNQLLTRFATSPETYFAPFSLSEAVLMKSDRRADGIFYSSVEHFPLGPK